MFLKALVALKPPMFSYAAVTQLLLYVQEYKRGTFGVSSPTDVVERVGGKLPDSFEQITRHEIALRPEGQRNLRNKMKAIYNFGKILVTPTPNVRAIARDMAHVQVDQPEPCLESEAWLASHSGVGLAQEDRDFSNQFPQHRPRRLKEQNR